MAWNLICPVSFDFFLVLTTKHRTTNKPNVKFLTSYINAYNSPVRIIFILQNAAKGMAEWSRKKGGCVLVPCLPGGLAGRTGCKDMAQDVCWSSRLLQGLWHSKKSLRLTDRDDCKRNDYWELLSSCKIPWRGESSKSHQRRVWHGFSPTAGWGLGASVQCTVLLLPLTVGPQLKPPPLG